MKAAAVIVTYQRLLSTRRCLDAFFRSSARPGELLIVDNSSDDALRAYLETIPCKKHYLDTNLGLYKALNIGISLTDSHLIAFLDCDIVVTDGWWRALYNEVIADESIALVGSRYLNPDGSLQEGFPRLSHNGWYGRNLEDRAYSSDCQYIAIGCSVFRKAAWEKVGGFDEDYFISHGDIDFCYKLRYEAGDRVRYCPMSSVIHDHAFAREEAYEKVRFDSRIVGADASRFRQKWKTKYAQEAMFEWPPASQ